MRFVSDSYIALFSHFVPCGAWEAVYIIDRLGPDERHWTDLLRTSISIREGQVSSVTLLRRLGNHSHKNRLYRAFRELGCSG